MLPRSPDCDEVDSYCSTRSPSWIELFHLLGTPGIRAQETDINNSELLGRSASSEGEHALIHSTKRVENVA